MLKACFFMFLNARAFDQNLSSWNVSSVTDARGMFFSASNFSQDLCRWGTHFQKNTKLGMAFVGSACPVSTRAATDLLVEPIGPLCFDCGSPVTESGNSSNSSAWESEVSGACVVSANCIASHSQFGVVDYPEDQFCGFIANIPGILRVELFSTEEDYDFILLRLPDLTLVTEVFSGTEFAGLDNKTIAAGTSILWFADYYDGALGWKLCLD